MTLRVRDLHAGEAEELARITRSRTLGAGLVRRAQIVQHAVDGLNAPEIAAGLDLCEASVRFWLKRFNARGLPGLHEERRSGRPPTYTPEERSAVITCSATIWMRSVLPHSRMLPKTSSIASPGRSLTGSIADTCTPVDATTEWACVAMLIRPSSNRMN